METARIKVESNATHSFPLIIAVRQTTGILSWQIPLLIDGIDLNSVTYNKTSRVLCSTKYYRYAIRDQKEFVIVSISTASQANVFFNLSVTEVADFYLRYIYYTIFKEHTSYSINGLKDILEISIE